MVETHSADLPNTARIKRCFCGQKFTVTGPAHKYCPQCAVERRRKRNQKSTAKWRRENTTASERTQARSEHRQQEDTQYGLVVYAHRDPVTQAIIYVGSGTFSRAKSCRRGGSFQRSPEHETWYKTHRRLGTIKTYQDFLIVLHQNVATEAEVLILEGQETLKALKQFSLFNKILPNPKRLNLTSKEIVRSFQQWKTNGEKGSLRPECAVELAYNATSTTGMVDS